MLNFILVQNGWPGMRRCGLFVRIVNDYDLSFIKTFEKQQTVNLKFSWNRLSWAFVVRIDLLKFFLSFFDEYFDSNSLYSEKEFFFKSEFVQSWDCLFSRDPEFWKLK